MDRSARSGAAHLEPVASEASAEVEDILAAAGKVNGYIPTSMRILAHKPDILRAFAGLINAIMRSEGDLPRTLKWLTAHAVSTAAGCRYCEAHTAANSNKSGLDTEKIRDLLNYRTSTAFSEAERAVIEFGLAAGEIPNGVTAMHFALLRQHFNEGQIVELVAVISLFGWLNRWNDTFASDLEDAPAAFAAEHLAGRGWTAGKHVLK